MSFDTSESFRSVMDSILLKPIGRALANPLTLAAMITFVIMIIVVYTYDEKHKFRTLLRIFGICTAFLFINNHILIQDINAHQLNPDQQNVLRSLERGRPIIVSRPIDSSASGGYVTTRNQSVDDEDEEGEGSNILEQLPNASSLVV